jgi:phosphoribosylformylglycinamidine (FGAM) synthase PurS component
VPEELRSPVKRKLDEIESESEIEAASEAEATASAETASTKLLANLIMESFHIRVKAI